MKVDNERRLLTVDICDRQLVDVRLPGRNHGRVPKKTEQDLLNEIEERLVDVYAEVSPQQVYTTVGQAHAVFEESPIRDFVPLLVERRARRELAALV